MAKKREDDDNYWQDKFRRLERKRKRMVDECLEGGIEAIFNHINEYQELKEEHRKVRKLKMFDDRLRGKKSSG